MGLKYLAGCQEDHLGTYFSGIEDYPDGGVVRTFTRPGLEDIMKNCDISLNNLGIASRRSNNMANGANSIHKHLRTELENYIKSQYFGKSSLLLNSVVNDLVLNSGKTALVAILLQAFKDKQDFPSSGTRPIFSPAE